MTFPAKTTLLLSALLAGCGGGDGGIDRIPASYQLTEPSLLVAVGGAGTLRVLKQSDLSVIATVPLRAEVTPHHLGLSSDKTKMTISLLPGASVDGGTGHSHGGGGDGQGEILVLSTTTGEELASTTVAGSAHNAAFLKDGRVVYADFTAGSIHFARIDPMTLSLTSELEVPVCMGPLEVSPTLDGQRLLVACQAVDLISIIDVTSRVKTDVAVGDGPIAAWIGTDNRYYVSNEGSKNLSVGSIGQTPTTIDLMYTPGQVLTNPAGTEVAIADEDGGRVVIHRVGDPFIKLAEAATGAGAHGIAWSADGKRLFVTNEGAGTVTALSHPDPTTLTVEMSVDVGPGPNGILAYTP